MSQESLDRHDYTCTWSDFVPVKGSVTARIKIITSKVTAAMFGLLIGDMGSCLMNCYKFDETWYQGYKIEISHHFKVEVAMTLTLKIMAHFLY